MAAPSNSSRWISLAKIEQSKHGFIVMLDQKCHSLLVINGEEGLSKYSVESDSWIKYTVSPSSALKQLQNLTWKATAIDCDKRKIFINHERRSIATFTLNDNDNKAELEIIDKIDELDADYGAKGIMIDGEFHIIGGLRNKHIKYNPSTRHVEAINDLHGLNHILYHQIARIKDKILMFGGEIDHRRNTDKIYEYCIATNKWSNLHYTIPKAMDGFGLTFILNKQFLVLLGGDNNNYSYEYDDGEEEEFQDSIYLYSIRDKTFEKSKVKCPTDGCYQAVTISDEKKDVIITFGYVRSIWKKCEISDHLFPPQYLIRIICGYYLNEFIHLFKIAANAHYKIDVFELFKS